MSEERGHPTSDLGTERMGALSDGVFAMATTLLVPDLRIPVVAPERLAGALRALGPSFSGYAVSFALLGIYWLGQRVQMHHLRRADHALHWLTILILGGVSLVPFSTALLARYTGTWLAIAVHGTSLIAIGVALYAHWIHGIALLDEPPPPVVVRFGVYRCLLAPVLYAVAIAVGFAAPAVSLAVCMLVPALYVLPGLQRIWLKAASR